MKVVLEVPLGNPGHQDSIVNGPERSVSSRHGNRNDSPSDDAMCGHLPL